MQKVSVFVPSLRGFCLREKLKEPLPGRGAAFVKTAEELLGHRPVFHHDHVGAGRLMFGSVHRNGVTHMSR